MLNKGSSFSIYLISMFVFITFAATAAAQTDTLTATHSINPSQYEPGKTSVVTCQITYTGKLTALGVEVDLPADWTLVAPGGSAPPIASQLDSGDLELFWMTPPASPVNFTYTVKVPNTTFGDQQISSYVLYRRDSGQEEKEMEPKPLLIPETTSYMLSASHNCVREYVPGTNIAVTNQIVYSGAVSAVGMTVDLPDGWTYTSYAGADPPLDVKKLDSGDVEFYWTKVPVSPIDFIYTVSVPATATGQQAISAHVLYRRTAEQLNKTVLPDTLTLSKALEVGTLEGKVIPNVKTVVKSSIGTQVTTAADGTFSLLHAAGIYTLTYEAEGYQPVTQIISVNAGETVKINDVTLTPVQPDAEPVASIIAPTDAVTVSEGESVNFQGNVTGGNAPFSYFWNFGGGAFFESKEDAGNITFSISGVYNVTFTVTDADGDKSTDSVVVTVVKSAGDMPVATISAPAGDVQIYEGESVTFEGSVTEGNTPFKYLWDFGGATAISYNEDPGAVTFHTAGVYTVIFSVADIDEDRAAAQVNVTVSKAGADTKPVASITSPASDMLINEGGSVDFQGSVTGGNAPFTYLWNFNGGSANVSSEDPGSVTFHKAGVYTVTFTVKETDKPEDSSTASKTVTVNKAVGDTDPIAAIASPQSNTAITEGESLNFQGSVTGGNAAFTYLWNFDGAAENFNIEDPGNVTFYEAGDYTVVFTVTDADGDVSKAQVTVTVKKAVQDTKPIAFISSPAADITVKEGESVTFEGTVTDGNAPFTYLWNFSGGVAISNVEDPGTLTFHTEGIYRISFTVAETGKPADNSTASRTVTVVKSVEDTVPKASIVSPVSNMTVREGESVTFEGSVTGGNAPFQYLWSFGGSIPNANVEDPGAVSFHTEGIYAVTFTVTETNKPEDKDTASVTITVVKSTGDTVPAAAIVSPPAYATINEGESLNFQGSVTGGNAPFSYLWDFGGGAPNANAEDPGAVTFSTAGTYTVIFTVTETNKVSDTDTASVTVTVLKAAQDTNPAAAIVSPGSIMYINEGESVNFQGAVTGGNAPFRYSWNFGGGASNSNMEDPGYVTFSAAGTYTVSFTVTDADSDVSSKTVSVYVSKVYYDLNPIAAINSPASDIAINEGESVNFQGSVTSGNAPFGYSWVFGGGVSNSAKEDPGSITFNTEGVYTVSFTVSDYDGDHSSDAVTVTVNKAGNNTQPSASIESPPSDMTVNVGESVNFQGYVTYGNSPFTYLWNFGGAAGNSDVEDPGSITFQKTGTYTVTFTVTDKDGDQSKDSVTITVRSISGDSSPLASIESPQGNVTVAQGGTVNFQGSVMDGNAPFQYYWDFGAGAANSTLEDPGNVVFSKTGIFTVTFKVTDADGDTASRTISVTVNSEVPAVLKGYMATTDLWIRAVINTVEKGPVDAVWRKGGEDFTQAGDHVIWGYFYADPRDVSWGSRQNPDLFVKIWFDHGGRIDVNYFHVSVPDIDVYSEYPYDGNPEGYDLHATTNEASIRYIRQYYENGQGYMEESTEDGKASKEYRPAGYPEGYTTVRSLKIGSVINTVEKGAIDGVWRLGGDDTTFRNDRVVWGLFYADPSKVTWGSRENPDAFVKIWFDINGILYVNFFHVSVPNIEVFSDFPVDGSYDLMGTTVLHDRYIRHEYKWK